MTLIKKKLQSKKDNAKKEGLMVSLTADEIQQKLDEAGIKVEQWNHKEYHLARYDDTGDYTAENCRFITAQENYAEKKVSKKMQAYYDNLDNTHMQKAKTPEMIKEFASRGGKARKKKYFLKKSTHFA